MKKITNFLLSVVLTKLLPVFKVSNLTTEHNKYFQVLPSYWAMIPVIEKGIDLGGKSEIRRHL